MRILIAADSFKDALPAAAVCKAIAAGVRRSNPAALIREFPMADGGEGTLDVLARHLGLETVSVATVDPLFRPLRTAYGLSVDGKTAVLEMARASGLQLLTAEQRNPLLTSTYGTGLMLADAWHRGIERALIAVGGSATSDAGTGLAAALGWQFVDVAGQALQPTGGNLHRIARIVAPQASLRAVSVEIICDVTNPLFGPQGAAHVYARQKGADEQGVLQLDAGLHHIAALLGRNDLAETPGAGAAGGLAFGALAFLNARLHRGVEFIMDLAGFDAALAQADLVITGEGHLDGQTLHGKLIEGICRRAQRSSIPVIALCGRVSASQEQVAALGLRAAICINTDLQHSLSQMLGATAENLTGCAATLDLGRLAK